MKDFQVPQVPYEHHARGGGVRSLRQLTAEAGSRRVDDNKVKKGKEMCNELKKASEEIVSRVRGNWRRHRDGLSKASEWICGNARRDSRNSREEPAGTSARAALLLLPLFLVCGGALAQETTDKYTGYSYTDGDDGAITITHKSPKWTQYRTEGKDYGDTYDTNDMVTLENGKKVQAANTYVDTIYMHKGTSIELVLPYRVSHNNASIYNYLRWFDYRTDSSYRWNLKQGGDENGAAIPDLLTPGTMNTRTRPIYRFANGYVVKNPGSGYVQSVMDFYYPTDEEFNSMERAEGFGFLDNDSYLVACDASIYTDFADNDGTEATFGEENNWCEPTLAGRALFYIIGVNDDDGADDGRTRPKGFEHYWNLLSEDYQGGVDADGNEVEGKDFLFEYDMDYPSRRFSNNTAEMVALSKDAQAYAIPGVSAEDDPEELDVTLIDEDNLGFNLTFSIAADETPQGYGKQGKISGDNRNIFFYKGTLGGLYSSTSGHCVPTDTQWYVPDGSKITILVTKSIGEGENATTYNLARFRVTFKDMANLLTQTQVHGLSELTGEEDYWWKDQTYRDSLYMETNYTKVASLTFDYGEDVTAATELPESNAGQAVFYPFPKGWDTSGYAFYDGSTNDINTSLDKAGEKDSGLQNGARFSMYCITNDYIAYWDSPEAIASAVSDRPPKYGKNTDGYWLYIDASERPGEVAEITLDGNLCQGSKLFGTAWIKGAGGSSSVDASLLLTLMGVRYEYDNDGNVTGETHTPLQRQCTGQVRATTRITEDNVNEAGLNSDVTGKGAGTNEWFQVYFSFITEGNVDYDYYTVKVDNYCAGTDGGDYYFDELKMYVLHAEADVMQLDPICTDGGRALVRLDLDYENIMARLGEEPEDHTDDETSTAELHLAMVNEYLYDTYLQENLKGDESYEDQLAIKAEAILEALVHFGNTDIDESNYHSFPICYFYLNFDLNEKYDEDNVGGNLPVNNGQYFYVRTDGDTGERILCSDMYSDMQAYTPYRIILLTSMDEEIEQDDNEANSKYFAQYIDDVCTITSDFYLTSTTVLKVDGEVVDPTVDYCAGQTVEIAPEVTYNTYEEDGDGNVTSTTVHTIPEGLVYFDWFFGTRDEYEEVNENFTDDTEEYAEGVSLHSALLEFRTYYPDAEVLSGEETPVTGAFTQACYDIIEHYLKEQRTGGLNNRLVLHSTNLSVRILGTGIALIIQPIGTTLYLDASGEPVTYDPDDPEATDGDLLEVCFGYVPLMLEASGDAPRLNAGFSDIAYPNSELIPCLRMGLEQMRKTTEDTPLTVNLRDAGYVAEKDEEGTDIEVDHLGRVTSAEGLDYLFLIDTDDPEYLALIDSVETSASGDEERWFTQYSLPVGRIKYLYANSDPTATDTRDGTPDIGSYMQVYFFTEDYVTDDGTTIDAFKPKEGYYYVVNVHFEEKGKINEEDGTSEAVGTACQGEIPLTIKIVPEYLVWKGESTSNWNNDSNWKRADRSDLHKTAKNADGAYPDDDPYPTNEDNTTDNGFVPMLFTKVIMPRDSEAELYMAGFIAGTDGMLSWQGDEDSMSDEGDDDDDDDDEETTSADVPEHPTPYIMYDLMVYETTSTDETTQATTSSLKTEHYRVNLCDEIHFEPGAQLLHSEQLIYSKAWTDVEIEQGPWTLAATPLMDVVSGDWYTKTETGTETAEYFTDITFDTDSCDRLDPMVYQRNWSNSGNTIVYTNGTDKGVPAYASTGWSSVYNDVTIPHQAGEGFSVKASRTINASTGEAENTDPLMFRFPKADEEYYYQEGSETPTEEIDRENAGRLLISSLVDRSNPDGDNDGIYKETSLTIELDQTENDYYIVGNPFTAAMSMKMFIAQNENVKAYWTGDDNGPIAGNGEVTSSGGDDYLLPPYTGFFITIDDESDTEPYSTQPVTICFTEDMQVLSTDFVPTGFSLSATNEQGSSKAYVAYNGSASDNYQLGEDVPLLEDVSWQREGLPMVYTVAGDMAVSINSLRRLVLIPLGVFADEGNLYTLSFVGVDKLESPVLIDTYEDTETPITEGLTLEMEGPTHGRYFIRTQGMATDIDDIEETAGEVNAVSVYSPVPRTVVVSSDAGIESVDIYSVGGMLLKRANAGGSVSCTIDGAASGIAIVRVKTTEGTAVRKIRVR